MAFPTVKLEIAWGTDPGSTTPSWTDMSAYIEGPIRIQRGKMLETDQAAADTMALRFDNADRRFEPNYASGLHYPNVKPMKRIRLTANYAATTYSLFDGFVDGWPQTYQEPAEALIDVTCTGWTKFLGNAKMPSPWLVETSGVNIPSMDHYWRLNEPSGSTAVLDIGTGTKVNGAVLGTTSLTSFGQSALPPYGEAPSTLFSTGSGGIRIKNATVMAGAAWSFECWMKMSTVGASRTDLYYESSSFVLRNDIICVGGTGSSPGLIVVSHDANGTVASTTVSTVRVDDGIAHHISVRQLTSNSNSLSIFIDGVNRTGSLTNATTGNTCDFASIGSTFGSNVQISDVMIATGAANDSDVIRRYTGGGTGWAGDLPSVRVLRILDSVLFPGTMHDLDNGAQTLAGQPVGDTALAGLQHIVDTEAGRLDTRGDGYVVFVGRTNLSTETRFTTSQAVFGDGVGEALYERGLELDFNDTLIYNDVSVTNLGGKAQVASNTSSQLSYQVRSLSKTALGQSDAVALGEAQWLATRYAQPLVRVRQITINPGADETLFPSALGLALGDRVTVKKTTPQGGVINLDFFIESILHEASDVQWMTTFHAAPAALGVQDFWVLGDAVRGVLNTSTRLGF